jgi:hypothetical protein
LGSDAPSEGMEETPLPEKGRMMRVAACKLCLKCFIKQLDIEDTFILDYMFCHEKEIQ